MSQVQIATLYLLFFDGNLASNLKLFGEEDCGLVVNDPNCIARRSVPEDPCHVPQGIWQIFSMGFAICYLLFDGLGIC